MRKADPWRNRLQAVGALLLALLVLTLSSPRPSTAVPAGHPDRGRVVYDRHCLLCHGPTGRGDGSAALGLSPRPASLVSAATSAKSDKELLHIIAEGKPHTAMRPWKELLTEEERRDVLAYIRTLVRFVPSSPATPSSTPPSAPTR